MTRRSLLLALCAILLAVSSVAADGTPSPHLELAVDRSAVHVGELITLRITYVNVGMPYTTIGIDPPGLVHFDPPLAQPCKWDQHPTGCQEITLRAAAPGAVTLTAGATGEIFDDACTCWRWWGGSATRPVTVIISGVSTFLPLVARN